MGEREEPDLPRERASEEGSSQPRRPPMDERIARPVDDNDDMLSEQDLAVLRGFQATTLRPSGWRPPRASDDVAKAPRPPASAEVTAPSGVLPEDLDVIPPELRRLFVKEAAEALDELRWHVLRLDRERGAGMGDSLLALGRVAHRVKGSAATLGFDVFADITLVFEDVVKATLSQPALDLTQAAAALVALLGLLD